MFRSPAMSRSKTRRRDGCSRRASHGGRASISLLALDILEDVAGNQIGRAFEVDNFETVDKSPNPQRIMIPFTVRAAALTIR